MIRYRFDSTLLDELPEGWDELDTTVRTERSLLFLRTVVTDARFTFYRDGYRYLRERWKNYGANCQDVVLTVEEDATDSGNWRPILRGTVKIPALKWSNEPDAVVVAVEDLSYFSFLNNNKKIEVNPELPLTKNGEPLVPPSLHTYDLFEPLTGTYNLQRDLYHVDELLEHLVTFLSDGALGFRSVAFGPGGKYEGYALQTIYRLRTGLTDDHVLSYNLEDFLRELGVNFRAALALEFDGSRPILRVEPEEDLYDAAVRLDLSEIHPILEEYDAAKLYGTVRVGSEVTQDQQGVLQFPEQTRWRGFIEEQYYLSGQCNTSAELDLMRKWSVSSNVLEDALYQNVDTNDESIQWVQVDRGLGRAVQDNWLTSAPPYYYNRDLTNEQTVRRWLGGIPSTLASELGVIPTGLFRASSTVNTSNVFDNYLGAVGTVTNSTTPVLFDDDVVPPNFDAGGVFDPVLYRFTPLVAGAYELESSVKISTTLVPITNWFSGGSDASVQALARVVFKRYNSGAVLVGNYVGPWSLVNFDPFKNQFGWSTNVTLNFSASHSLSIPFDLGDYCQVELQINSVTALGALNSLFIVRLRHSILFDSTFACIRSSDFGNFTQEADPANFRAALVKLEAPLTRQQMDHLLGDLTQRVRVTTQGRSWSGWLESLKYDHRTGTASITLSTSTRLLP